MELTQKEERLYEIMKGYAKKDICIAFSGGADSSLLLKLAVKCAAPGVRVHAVTFETVLHPSCDLDIAKQVAKETGAIHKIIFLDEFEDERIKKNPKNRCYLCKKSLFEKLLAYADEAGAETILEGTNEDDLHVYRPGLAAVRELGVKSPLAEAHLTKPEVRALARKEVPVAEFGKFMEQREAVLAKLKELGFVYVTLDMEGFRSGSMDVDAHDD